MLKRWINQPYDQGIARSLHESLKIDPLFCTILAQRGITSFSEAQLFFRPTLDHLHDPYLMRDMDIAVHRLQAAIEKNEKILLYGDYDVDGTTSVAMMFSFLRHFHPNLDYYLPDRDKEGYGVSLASIDYAKAHACTLMIVMDCGIKAHAAIEKANSFGIDVIVCDHHLPEGQLPAAVAVLDPKRPDCNYPFKELSGCGVAFKLAQALAREHQTPVEDLEHLLDLVALSIACDVVPMVGENRILTYFGLQRINRDPRIGLWALINKSNRKYPLIINDLVFGLGPLINAAGRLGDARDAVKMLLASERNSALESANQLIQRNKQRQEVDLTATTAARLRVREQPNWEDQKSVVLFDPEWHKGVIGITASRVAEDFHRPTVILTQSDGRAVGSARSIPGFDLYNALQTCEPLFYSFGGHAHAAGMQMPIENVAKFAAQFETIVRERLHTDIEIPIIDIACTIRLDQITSDFWRILKQFAPFGPHNMNPVFCVQNVVDTGKSRILQNNHVRFDIKQDKTIFYGIGFGLAQEFETLRNGPFDLAFNLREETWQGQTFLSLQVKDIKKSADF